MVTKHRPTRPKNPTQAAVARFRKAAAAARAIIHQVKRGDSEALAEATLLTGIISGDITAAAVCTRLRLQKENLRLRQLLARSRLTTEELKQRAARRAEELIAKAPTPEQAQQLRVAQIRAIYGLTS